MWNGWWWNGWQWVPLPPPAPPRRPSISAEVSERIGARFIDGFLGTMAVWLIAPAVGPDGRPVLAWLLGIAAFAALEAATTVLWGGSIGKLMVGIRVRELDAGPRVRWTTALRRSLMTTFIGATIVLIPFWLGSVIASANRRGFHDRRWGTIVVPRRVQHVAREDLATFDAEERPAPVTAWGKTAPIDRRIRARAYRLDGAWLLMVALVPMLWALGHADNIGDVMLAALVFLVAFVIDETIRVHRTGGNPGHHRAGLAVLDVNTGRPPTVGRSLARAIVLAIFLYVPLLQLALAINVFASDRWRGVHDLAGRTVVVARF